MFDLKVVQVRLTEDIYDWLVAMAKIEGVPVSTMIRIFLSRELYSENIKKQFDKKKKGGK